MSSTRALAISIFLALMSGCGVDFGHVDMSKVVPAPESAQVALASVFPLYRSKGMVVPPALYYYGGAALDCPNGIDFTWNGECSDGATGPGALRVSKFLVQAPICIV